MYAIRLFRLPFGPRGAGALDLNAVRTGFATWVVLCWSMGPGGLGGPNLEHVAVVIVLAVARLDMRMRLEGVAAICS